LHGVQHREQAGSFGTVAGDGTVNSFGGIHGRLGKA
jgi:hypothetical protein